MVRTLLILWILSICVLCKAQPYTFFDQAFVGLVARGAGKSVVTNGLVAHWQCNEGVGTNITDSSTTGITNVVFGGWGYPNGPQWSHNAIPFSWALNFNTNGGYIDGHTNAVYNIGNSAFSLCCWMKHTNSTYTDGEGIAQAIDAVTGNIIWAMKVGNYPYLNIGLSQLGFVPDQPYNPGTPAGYWTTGYFTNNADYYLCWTRSGFTWTMYINGSPVRSLTGSANYTTNPAVLYMGLSGSTNVALYKRWNGYVSELSIYNNTLSASNINWMYHNVYGQP